MPASDVLGGRDAWHLLRRAGFGARARELAKFAGLSRAEAVDALLAAKPSAARAPVAATAGLEAVAGLQAWWLRRMASARYRLQEKMVLFWHDHFPSAVAVLNRLDALSEQNAMFRLHGLGPLRELLHQVTRNRAMLEYLDGRLNRVGAVNENYGRELMELFTLGPRDEGGSHNYQQTDVAMLSRALTGFTYDEHVKKPGGVETLGWGSQLESETSGLGRDLREIASIVRHDLANPGAPSGFAFYHARMFGFDTHSRQGSIDPSSGQPKLLAELSRCLLGFQRDLEAIPGASARVVTLVYSEFGRRAAQNASGAEAGTDHGAGGLLLLVGNRVVGGVHGALPRLDDLDATGNLKVTTDFRTVYAAVIDDLLGGDHNAVLPGAPFDKLPVIQV